MRLRTAVIIFSSVIVVLVMAAGAFLALTPKGPKIDMRGEGELQALLQTDEFKALRKKNSAGKFPDKLELLDLLRESRFDDLDARLVAYQKGYESDKIDETYVSRAFYAFGNSDPTLQVKLDQWVLMMPRSYAATLARGIYHWNLGWVSRQYELSRKTSRERFRVMDIHLTRATSDLKAAINFNKRLSVAYGFLISIAMVSGPRRDIEKISSQGLKENPNSVSIRTRNLFALYPMWGGSVRAIRAYIDDMKPDWKRHPKLRVFKTYVLYAAARNLARKGKRREAIELFTKAIQIKENSKMLYWRGLNFYALKDYDKALADFDRSLELYPQDASVLDSRAWAHRKLKHHHQSLADWNLALKLDAMEPDVLWARSLVLRNLRFYNESLRDLDKALIYGADDDRFWNERGHLYLYGFKNNKKAIPDFEQAIELNPSARPDHWYHLGIAFYNLHDCKFIDTFTAYRRICENKKTCKQDRLDWVNLVVRDLTNWGKCPK